MIGLTKETYTVEPREPVILTPYIEPIASDGKQDGNILHIKDHIGAKVLLNFGFENGNLHECTISHLSQNEQAVFMIFEGDAHNRWLTIEKFNQLFFDFIEQPAQNT